MWPLFEGTGGGGENPKKFGVCSPGGLELSHRGRIMLSVSDHAESQGLLRCSQKAGESLGI